jgi:tRNA (cmo5U34)-methyltransferase
MADIAEQFPAGGWSFTQDVADVFPDHVRASVPYYDVIQATVAEMADWLIPDGGLVADLGASTGTTVRLICDRLPGREIRAALYDESEPMLDRARLALDGHASQLDVHTASLPADPLKHSGADLTLALFLLQFLPAAADRVGVLRAARGCSADTGALLVAEKTRPVDSRWAEIANDVSHDWKAAHGISDAAIRAKARSLRGVLIPWTLRQTIRTIESAGWHNTEILYRWHSWAVLGAWAEPQ